MSDNPKTNRSASVPPVARTDAVSTDPALIKRMELTLVRLAREDKVDMGYPRTCEHWRLMARLKDELRTMGPMFKRDMFRQAATQLGDHLDRCDQSVNESRDLEVGIAKYARLLGEDVPLWFSEDAFAWLEDVERNRPPSVPEAHVTPEIVKAVVDVASYLGTAGLGGIIGNRADAAFVDSVKHLFDKARRRWRKRTLLHGELRSSDEAMVRIREFRSIAVDAAAAAALALGYEPTRLIVISASPAENGSWVVLLKGLHRTRQHYENLRAIVPDGDPATTKVLITAKS